MENLKICLVCHGIIAESNSNVFKPPPPLVLTHYSQLLLLIQHKNIYISFFEGTLIYFPFVTKKKCENFCVEVRKAN